MRKLIKAFCLTLMLVLLMTLVPVQSLAADADTWDGSADTSWYDASQSTFVLTTAEQLAGLSELSTGGVTFAGKTVKLGADIDLASKNFEPINYFAGTFDGDGHTISNLSISTNLIATLSQRYIGLFREVNNATVKNLNMDNAQLIPYWDDPWEHYQSEMGIVVSKTSGTCTFENIKVMNSSAMTYNNTVGGVVGEAYGDITFKNVQVDASNTFGAYWQSHDSCTGGILGYSGSNVTVTFDDCYSAAVLDVYNDVQANYQYYLYRYSGMLIGNVKDPATTTIKATNTTVGFGDWNQYKYCEFQELGHGSYNGPEEWKYTRTDSGNSLLAPGHTHRDYEDHELLLPFENLTGRATGGTPDYTLPGVTIKNNSFFFILVEDDTADGAGIYPAGSTATLTANIPEGMVFDSWEILDGEASLSGSPATFTVDSFLRVKAIFAEAPAATEVPAPTEAPVGTESPAVSEAPADPTTAPTSNPQNSPVTGDNSNLYLWMAISFIALVAAVVVLKPQRKSN